MLKRKLWHELHDVHTYIFLVDNEVIHQVCAEELVLEETKTSRNSPKS